ncbi:MAG: helix-turn-helix transcriptional regulator [Clostridia bacterium]|nr:helix-turn-helix transcriptional regulator [Clostridia bacterium]
MEFPQFELIGFGVYDSHVLHSGKTYTTERTVTFYEIELFLKEDNGISFINGDTYTHGQGDFICAKPGYKRYSKLHISCYFLHLLPKNEKAKVLLESIPTSFKPGDVSEYVRLFNKMIQLRDEENNELYLLTALSSILQMIRRDSGVNTFEAGITGNKKALLNAEKYLKENYQKNISLEKLAKEHNLSPIYFHKLFTSFFHKTPNKYLLDLKINKAKVRLLEENYNLPDIALECGFSSQSYFCYKFKEQTGLSPLAFRKRELAKMEI